MTATNLLPGTHAGDAINRDRWGRPLIKPLNGGDPEPYTRVSTLAKTLDDQSALMDWKARTAVKGVVSRPDLLALAQATPLEDRKTLNGLVKNGMEAAAASKAANMGTAIHSFTEAIDLGNLTVDQVPAEQRPLVQDYLDTMKRHDMQTVSAENFVVQDDIKAAGTFDRLLLHDGKLLVGDIKTGTNVKFLALATAIQIAVYANSVFYDIDTGARSPMPVDRTTGILIHLPQDGSPCALYSLDLEAAWHHALLAAEVRLARKAKVHQILE